MREGICEYEWFWWFSKECVCVYMGGGKQEGGNAVSILLNGKVAGINKIMRGLIKK